MSKVLKVSALLMVFLPLAAGEIGNYVGFNTTDHWIYAGRSIDSTLGFPDWQVTSDTILYDSVWISLRFQYNGTYPAYERSHHVVYSDSITSHQDTFFEVTDTEMKMRFVLFDQVDTAALMYKTNLTPGMNWCTGLEGSYVIFADQDATPDTLYITNDTVYVLESGTYSVPGGTFTGVKLMRRGRMEMAFSSGGRGIEWLTEIEILVPYVGTIFDSIFIVDSVSGYETHKAYSKRVLVNYTSVKEFSNKREVSFKTLVLRQGLHKFPHIQKGGIYRVDGSKIGEVKGKSYNFTKSGIYFLIGKDTTGREVEYKILVR